MSGLRFLSSLAVAVIALTLFAACDGAPTGDDNVETGVTVEMSADHDDGIAAALGTPVPGFSTIVLRLPYQTFGDWVSYSDQYSVFTVLDEEMILPTEDQIERGDVYIWRSVHARIEKTTWSAPDMTPIEGEIRMIVRGWTGFGTYVRPAGSRESGRIEVGERYMAPLVLYEYDHENAWGTIGQSALRLEGDVVVGPLGSTGLPRLAIIKSLIGKTVDEVATILANTERDPRAVQYSHLLPEARSQAVQYDLWRERDPLGFERLPIE